MTIRDRIRVPSKNEILRLVVAVAFGVLVTVSIVGFFSEPEWSPLGPYPVQQVDSQGPLVPSPERDGNLVIPQVALGSTVHATGQKCADENVTVQSEFGWRSIVPNGFYYEVPQGGPGRRLKGCESLDFNNEIPAEVEKWARVVIANSEVPAVYIGGCETPISEDGDSGSVTCWRTEPFVVRLP